MLAIKTKSYVNTRNFIFDEPGLLFYESFGFSREIERATLRLRAKRSNLGHRAPKYVIYVLEINIYVYVNVRR